MTLPNHCAFLWHFIAYFCGILLRIFVETKWFDFTEGICIKTLLRTKKAVKVGRIGSVHKVRGYSYQSVLFPIHSRNLFVGILDIP